MTFYKLVLKFSKKCGLSKSMIAATKCIAQLLDDVLDSRQDNYPPDFINVLSKLIDTRSDAFDHLSTLKIFANWEQEKLNQTMKILTIFFHLLNQAELLEISRINRIRGNDSTKDIPRPDSIFEAVKKISKQQNCCVN